MREKGRNNHARTHTNKTNEHNNNTQIHLCKPISLVNF